MKNNVLKNAKAITLIAMVVTIIVLLILAGVSIAVLTGENGLLNRATSAKQTHKEKTEEEKLKLGVLALSTEYRSQTTHAADEDKFSKFVNKEANKTKLANELGVETSAIEIDTAKDILTYRDKKYKLDNIGGIADYTPVAVTINIDGTDTQITADDDMSDYYGKEVTNYTTGGTYRIFYIDFAGKYGAKGTIYLKADPVNITIENIESYNPISTTQLEKMNPKWAINRLQYKDSSDSEMKWDRGEYAIAFLCDPTTEDPTSSQAWLNYFSSSKAEYVIGSPSLEIFADSYNQVTHIEGNNVLIYDYVDRSKEYAFYGSYWSRGYQVGVEGGNLSGGTDEKTLDSVGYGRMYAGWNEDGLSGGYVILATSNASNLNESGGFCVIGYPNYKIGGASGITGLQRIMPLVSLKSTFIPQISSTN